MSWARGTRHGADSVMSLPPGSKLDDTTTSCLRLTRSLDLRPGTVQPERCRTSSVCRSFGRRAKGATRRTIRSTGSTPAAAGRQLTTGLRVQAEEDFAKAEQFGPGLAKAHVDLGNAELANRDYLEAVEETAPGAGPRPSVEEPP